MLSRRLFASRVPALSALFKYGIPSGKRLAAFRSKSSGVSSFNPENLEETEKNITIIKHLVALTASEIIDPKLSALVTKNYFDESMRAMQEKMDARFVHADERMDAGFARADERMDAGFARADEKMDAGFARADERMDAGFARADERMDAGFARISQELKAEIQALRSDFHQGQRDSMRWFLTNIVVVVGGLYTVGFFNRFKKKEVAVSHETSLNSCKV